MSGVLVGWDWLKVEARAATGYVAPDDSPEEAFPDDVPPEMVGGIAPWEADLASSAPISTRAIRANSFELIDPRTIPTRRWLYDRHYIRGFLGLTAAPGGTGKSVLLTGESLAMVTGRNLLGHLPCAKLRAWYINLEDPTDELQRRITAACLYHKITREEIGGRLYVNSGRDTPIILASDDRSGFKIATPVIGALKKEIQSKQIDVLIIDPFVASHGVSENDNVKINAICRELAMLAEATNCAIELAHHVRKGGLGQSEYTVDDARGAGALLAAVRSARTLNVMSKDEAARAGVAEHWSYFRVDNGKANLAPPADKSTWRHHVSVQLGNGETIPHAGDNVGVVTQWNWPDPSDDVTTDDVRAVQEAVAAGDWREDVRARANWVGYAIGKTLNLDPDEPYGKATIKALLKSWIEDGTLKIVERRDQARKVRSYVEVGKRPRHE